MEKEKLEYRQSHPKCKWCKWYKYNTWQDCHWITCYGECTLKDKIINYDSIPRLCQYYKVKESKNDYEKNTKMDIR